MLPFLAALSTACPSSRSRDNSGVMVAAERISDIRMFDQYKNDAGIFNLSLLTNGESVRGSVYQFAVDYILATPEVRNQIALTPESRLLLSRAMAHVYFRGPADRLDVLFIRITARRLLDATVRRDGVTHFVDFTPLGGGERQSEAVR